MSRGVQAFKQTDVSKAIRASRNAGLVVDRVEIDKGGKIVIVTSVLNAATAPAAAMASGQ